MTPEQKELKVEAFRALLNDKSALAQFGHVDNFPTYIQRPVGEIGIGYWTSDTTFIRLAPPAEIPLPPIPEGWFGKWVPRDKQWAHNFCGGRPWAARDHKDATWTVRKPEHTPTGDCEEYLELVPEIPWHNPEGVTQEQLEPEKGWRFLTVDEVGSNNIPAAEWGHSTWGDCTFSPTLEAYTYRTQSDLPAKYQHLVPESEEARARRLLLEVAKKEGYGDWGFDGIGPVKAPAENEILANYDPDERNWRVDIGFNGQCEDYFYARARKLPTDQEKAEAALNAYKLEPGERLVHRGKEWTFSTTINFLRYNASNDTIARIAGGKPSGYENCYYAEIIKEPELVPFTQETFPLGAWIKGATGVPGLPTVVHSEGVFLSNNKFFGFQEMLDQSMLISTDSGTTWTRAGKGVEK